ncbi:MAG TPA: DUF542 domain-containing protein, partial [Thermoanaerobaculia bacterium]|nr:DUF542 domain-containing protein [Thermoanaerobaculia bacterium]
MTEPSIDPKTPVKELLERYPHLASALAAHGVDTCCGGIHPLEQACAARGVSLEEVVRDLESAHGAAESHSIVPPTMSVRDVRRRYPSTIPVFEKFGLGDCGGDEGPDEPVAWFATVHRIPLEEFLREIRAAAVRDNAAAPASAAAPAKSASLPFSPHFILGSLFLTLTLGATAGMINLLRIAAGAEVALSHRQIHGHTQILGFAALFLMGIAYHALPRILGVAGSMPKTRFSPRTAFWLMATGVIARNFGQPLGFYPAGRALSLLSAFLETAGAALFVSFVFGLIRRVREGKYDRRDPLLRFVRSGTLFFALAMLVNAAQGIWLAGHVEAALPPSLTEPFFAAAVYGFLLAWIYGFGNRVVTLFLGLAAARRGTPEAALWTQAAGVILSVGSWIPGLPDKPALLLRDAGLCLLAISALVYLAGNGFLWRRPVFAVPRVPGTPSVAIRCAFGCLGLWALLEIAAVVVSRTTRLPAQNPWWSDAARHTFTVGFLTLVIIGMSFRILPVFSGKSLWSPRLA